MTVGMLVWDAVCIGLCAVSVAVAAGVSGADIGDVDLVGVVVCEAVALTTPVISAVGCPIGIAVTLPTIAGVTVVGVGSGDCVSDGVAVPIANTDVT